MSTFLSPRYQDQLVPVEPHLNLHQSNAVFFSWVINMALLGQLRSGATLHGSRDLIFKSCQIKSATASQFLYTQNPSKPYYVTTPIFYVNAGKYINFQPL